MTNALLVEIKILLNAYIGVLNIPKVKACLPTYCKAYLMIARLQCFYNAVNMAALFKFGLC